MDEFVQRMVRGLLYSVKKTIVIDPKVTWHTQLPPDTFTVFAPGISRDVGDIFSYRVLFTPESGRSFWLLTFYEHLHLVAALEPKGTPLLPTGGPVTT